MQQAGKLPALFPLFAELTLESYPHDLSCHTPDRCKHRKVLSTSTSLQGSAILAKYLIRKNNLVRYDNVQINRYCILHGIDRNIINRPINLLKGVMKDWNVNNVNVRVKQHRRCKQSGVLDCVIFSFLQYYYCSSPHMTRSKTRNTKNFSSARQAFVLLTCLCHCHYWVLQWRNKLIFSSFSIKRLWLEHLAICEMSFQIITTHFTEMTNFTPKLNQFWEWQRWLIFRELWAKILWAENPFFGDLSLQKHSEIQMRERSIVHRNSPVERWWKMIEFSFSFGRA